MDKIHSAVLRIINEQCPDGIYKILEPNNIISRLPKYIVLDKAGLKDVIDYLTAHNLIMVKYSDISEYCLTALSKGHLVGQKIDTDNQTAPSKISRTIFWNAFFGAIAGVLVVEVLLPFLRQILGV